MIVAPYDVGDVRIARIPLSHQDKQVLFMGDIGVTRGLLVTIVLATTTPGPGVLEARLRLGPGCNMSGGVMMSSPGSGAMR